MNPKVKELRQQRSALIAEMHDLTETSGFPEEAQTRWAEKDKLQKALDSQIRRMEETDTLLEEQRKVIVPPQPPIADPAAAAATRETATTGPEAAVKRLKEKLGSEEYRSAFFNGYIRRGAQASAAQVNMLEDVYNESRTYTGLNVGTGTQGGYVVPIGFQREVEIKMKAYGRMRENCRVINTTSGGILDWPTMDDTANYGRWVAEAASVVQTNPTYGQVQFSAYLGSSDQVLISVQLLQDSAFNLEDELATAFGIRLGRLTNYAYTKGTGNGQPNGLVTSILAQASPNTVQAVGSTTNDGISGNTEANSIGSDDLDDLISAVDPAYRTNAIFMFNWRTIDALRKLKDRYGRPLWVSSLAVGEPDRIYGYKFDWNADMDAMAAGANSAIFGDFSKYVIRDVGGLTVVRFNELFMGSHQIGFQAFLRTDGQLLQPAAFSLLHNPLS